MNQKCTILLAIKFTNWFDSFKWDECRYFGDEIGKLNEYKIKKKKSSHIYECMNMNWIHQLKMLSDFIKNIKLAKSLSLDFGNEYFKFKKEKHLQLNQSWSKIQFIQNTEMLYCYDCCQQEKKTKNIQRR